VEVKKKWQKNVQIKENYSKSREKFPKVGKNERVEKYKMMGVKKKCKNGKLKKAK
jgi:hypothetical protein